MVRPAPQPPCAHPSTRRRLRPASHCLPAAPFLWAAGGGVSATPSSALPEGTHRLNLADDHLQVTGVPFSIVSNTNADTSTRSFLDDPGDRELRASRIDRELHAKPSSALRCPHTFPRAAAPDGTRALTTRRR